MTSITGRNRIGQTAVSHTAQETRLGTREEPTHSEQSAYRETVSSQHIIRVKSPGWPWESKGGL